MILPELPWPLAFLQLNDYLNCQRKFNHKHVAKDALEKKSGAQRAGIDVHDQLKRYIKFNEPLAPVNQHFERAVLPIKKQAGEKFTELGLGATADGRPCSFFDLVCRLRGRIDVCVLHEDQPSAFIVDWKTGKPWEDPLELKIQALLLKIHHPNLVYILGGYYWLRENRMGKLYDLSQADQIWLNVWRWSMGIKSAIETGVWQPDENPLCPWCPVSKVQCEFKKDQKS